MELWKFAFWSLSSENNFYKDILKWINIGGMREGFCCLWPAHYKAEIATICNNGFVQRMASVSAFFNTDSLVRKL